MGRLHTSAKDRCGPVAQARKRTRPKILVIPFQPIDRLARLRKAGPSMRMATAGNLVSVREASARTGVPVRTLYYWIKNGRMWHAVVADRICVHEDDVRLLEGRKAS